jgi:type I restriction enzyme, S subunit
LTMGTYKKVKLTDIADINPKTSFENLEPSTEVSFIPMQSVSEEGRIIDYQVKQFDEVKKGYTSFVENDILLAKITPCMENGKRAIATNLKNGIGFGSTEFHVIRPKESVIPKYLFYFISQDRFRKLAEQNMTGSAGQKRVPATFLKSISLYIPPLDIQRKIIYILDKAQELIDKRKSQIEALDQLAQSVFLEMFGDPIKNVNQYKKEKLANLCIKITDGTHHSPPIVKEGIPYITAKHLDKRGLDFFKDPTYVSLEDHQKIYERCNPEKGDVLYIKDGATTGIAAINHYDFEFSMLSSLALIKVDFNKLNNYYLTHFLNNERVFRKITSGMNGGAIKRLTLKKINNIEVVVPPIELQNQFAEIIKKIEIQKELLQKSLEELENNFNSLMQRAFKGELFND